VLFGLLLQPLAPQHAVIIGEIEQARKKNNIRLFLKIYARAERFFTLSSDARSSFCLLNTRSNVCQQFHAKQDKTPGLVCYLSIPD
jgi:hypothetical protein